VLTCNSLGTAHSVKPRHPMCSMALLRLFFGLAICGYSLNPVTILSLQQKPKRKPVVWIHIHKSGGSTVCEAARQNGEHTANFSNCNFLSDDYLVQGWNLQLVNNMMETAALGGIGDAGLLNRVSSAFKPLTCEERMQKVRAQSVTWMQIEREFNKGDFCDGFLYGISLRDPAMLAQSLVNYNGIGAGYKKCLEQPAEHCAEKSKGPVWIYFDNFMVRVLGGHDVMMLPPGSINATHEKMALDILAKFHVVVRTEDFNKNAALELFRETFGWSAPDALRKHKNSEVNVVTFSEEELTIYKELNQHDYAIYNSVRGFEQIDSPA